MPEKPSQTGRNIEIKTSGVDIQKDKVFISKSKPPLITDFKIIDPTTEIREKIRQQMEADPSYKAFIEYISALPGLPQHLFKLADAGESGLKPVQVKLVSTNVLECIAACNITPDPIALLDVHTRLSFGLRVSSNLYESLGIADCPSREMLVYYLLLKHHILEIFPSNSETSGPDKTPASDSLETK